MTQSQNITVRRMSADEMQAACEVIGLAFADNPNTLAVAGGDAVRARLMMQAAVRAAKLARKCSYVLVADNRGRVIGVLNSARWPQCQMRGAEMLMAAPSILRAMGSALLRQLTITRAWAMHDPRKPHWHVGPIGVHPEFQGKGVGSALLTAFLEMVDHDGLPAYLETDVDRNVSLYRQFGFEVIGRKVLLGVNNRFMWREARSER